MKVELLKKPYIGQFISANLVNLIVNTRLIPITVNSELG